MALIKSKGKYFHCILGTEFVVTAGALLEGLGVRETNRSNQATSPATLRMIH